ncbi:hypothetical protein KR009_007151 [Drosophila setifemur]|nr:hypothetical protein KR009_007151 [Drosophila setifemur]
MWLVRILYLLSIVALFLLLGYCGESVDGSSESGNPIYGDFYGNASSRWFRFRNFEPRQQRMVLELEREEKEFPKGEREGRGFHFHASGEDVSVELEFIVPFLKVPVKRSMNLARDAVQSILNLRTGALLNTAVVVAAGAVIAGVVRLLLAPLVISTLGNGYGYKSEHGRGSKYREHSFKLGYQIYIFFQKVRRLTDVVESQLEENNIDMSVCVQRLICQYLQRNLSSGYARVLNVLTSSSWIHTFVNGTAVFHAIQSAKNQHNCDHTYPSCRWPINLTSGVASPIKKFFNG